MRRSRMQTRDVCAHYDALASRAGIGDVLVATGCQHIVGLAV